MKIKYRLSLAICSILVLLGSILSASTSYIVNEKMEKNLTNYLNEIMRSTREVIKYNIATDNSLAKEQVLKDQAEYISNYISLNYKCKVDIRDINGEIYWSNIEEYNNKITESLEQTKNGQAIVNLVSTGNGIDGILSYPIYINEKYLGIIDIVKNYEDMYKEYNNMMLLIISIEITILVAILFLLIRLLNQ